MHAQNTPSPRRKKPAARKAACRTPRQIADRLHDAVCQSLTGARLLLCVVQNQLPQDAADLRQQLKNVDDLLDESCTELTALMKDLQNATKHSA